MIDGGIYFLCIIRSEIDAKVGLEFQLAYCVVVATTLGGSTVATTLGGSPWHWAMHYKNA